MFEKPVFGRKGFVAAAQKFSDFVAGGDEFDLGGLTEELAHLDVLSRGFGNLAKRWVANGDHPAFESKFDYLRKNQHMIRWQLTETPELRNAFDANVKQSNLALARGEIANANVIARFIRLRRMAYPCSHYSGRIRTTDDTDRDVRELLDALSSGMQAANYGKKKDELLEWPSATRVLSLIQHLGGRMEHYLFATAPSASNVRDPRPLADEPEYRRMISENPEVFLAVLVQHDEVQAIKMIRLIGYTGNLTNAKLMAGVFSRLGKGNPKVIREQAINTLVDLDEATLPAMLKLGLAEGELEMRFDLVQIAGKANTEATAKVLEDHLPNERSGKVKGAIEAVLGSSASAEPEANEPLDEGNLALANGDAIALDPIDENLLSAPVEEDRAAFLKLVSLANESRKRTLAAPANRTAHVLQTHAQITDDEANGLFDYLIGQSERPTGKKHLGFAHDLHQEAVSTEIRDWIDTASPPLVWRTMLWLSLGGGFKGLVEKDYFDHTLIRKLFLKAVQDGEDILAFSTLVWKPSAENISSISHHDAMRSWLQRPRYYSRSWENPLEVLPAKARERLIASSLPAFDEALGLAPAGHNADIKQTFAMLAMLPAVPERYVAKLFELGLSGKREEREGAQKLLHNVNGLADRLIGALDDRRQDARGHAATWLADIRAKDAEKALRKRLKKEKAEKVRAALIEALIRLEADLSDVIGPEALVAEAEKKGGKLALPEWLSAETLPHVRFADGSAAPRSLIEYWIGLAVKLKDPGNTGLFGIYLDQLAPEDARTLSGQILQGWIDYDTAAATLDEANAIANATVDTDWRRGIGYSREKLFAVIVKETMNKLNNTGTKSKGILALACRAEPAFAADRVRAFLKKHGRRSHQAMALLDMLAGMNSPTAMQVVISAATRLKQKSTMAHANAIAERYAQDRGWSYDELADRTVPTAGFDDDGVLDLPCGEDEKPYIARIDASLAVHLYNPAGKVIKSLPASDDEVTKESKKALSAAKREMKQIVTMQTDRLREALTNGRQWPVADWQEAFHGHPVMRRLIERLVWQGMDGEGNALGLFRATQEGDFTDAEDNDVALADFAEVRLAHAAHVDSDVAKAWRAHLKDYEIKPLLDQFPASYKPLGGEDAEATAITDRFGWVGDSLSYRGLAEKLGYSREMGDGGGCVGYTKSFPAHEITAVIVNSGSHAYDENNKVVLKELIFRHRGAYGGMKLSEVPPVLLAMCHADLHTIAKKGTYAEDWEKQVEW